MSNTYKTFVSLLLTGALSAVPSPSPGQSGAVLNISPTFQETQVWCWAAVSEMVFRHYGFANINPFGDYQCGVVGSLGGQCAVSCTSCIFPAGQLANIQHVLMSYPDAVRAFVDSSAPDIRTTGLYRPLSWEEIVEEISAGRPIVAAISPSMIPIRLSPEHVALVIGYEETFNARNLIVNDPFPYLLGPLAPFGDPYLQVGGQLSDIGQYRIPYQSFVTGLQWEQTIYGIQETDDIDVDFDDTGTGGCQVGYLNSSPNHQQLLALVLFFFVLRLTRSLEAKLKCRADK